MAKDENDKSTPDFLEKPKNKVGRPLKYGHKMTPAERMARSRERMKQKIEHKDPDDWDERTCIEVMTNRKYSAYKAAGWKRYGVINKLCDSD